jgi:hypothetical protein
MSKQTDYRRDYNAKVIAKGGGWLPSGVLQPGDARILRALLADGYAETPRAVLVKALHAAYARS